MTTFAHVSDLHFGAHDAFVEEALRRDLIAAEPAVVLVSGDLTQRARGAQFRAARAWLDSLALPWLAVPGNHDIPLYDVFRRFLAPLARWRRLVEPNLAPRYEDDALLVLGLNTARPTRWKEGRVSREQLETVRRTFLEAPTDRLKVLVTHHPFLPPPADRSWTPMERAEEALRELDACGLDLLLSGHQHLAYSSDVRRHYEKVSRTMLVAHSGTSLSVRSRGEPNTWNLFRWSAPVLDLEVRAFRDRAFQATGSRRFSRDAEGWRTIPDPRAAVR